MHGISRILVGCGCAAILCSSPAAAKFEPRTQLVRCGEESCLQVSGRRDHAGQQVAINGMVTDAEGGRRWRVNLPIATVRTLCEPRANTLTVALLDSEAQAETVAPARLPIGLLGDVSSLGSLQVTAP